MKLRARLAVAIAATTLPMVGGLIVLDAQARQDAAEEELHDFVVDRLSMPGEREACEGGRQAEPPHGHGPPGPPPPWDGDRDRHRKPARVYGYDARGRSPDPDAPSLSTDAFADLEGGGHVSRSTLWNAGDVEIVLRTPWAEGPCAFALARGTKEPWLGAILPPTRVWLTPLIVVALAGVFALGPVVRRLRRLRCDVERQAASGYRDPVEPLPGDDEVGALSRAFAAAGREVQTLLEDKDRRERALREFIADTTHDVMIPLTVLQGHLAKLRDADAIDHDALGSAMQESHYIASLLQNLSVAAKLDSAEPQLQRSPVDLGALLERVVARHRPIGAQLGVSLEGSSPEPAPWVDADLTMLEQALGNLVYNAVRHNRRGGHVAAYVDVQGDRFVAHVVDDGPGIAEEMLTKVRARGVRGDGARTRTPDGHGLGLSIAARVCELHGLELEIGPGKDRGVHVRIEGPTMPAP